MSDTFKVLIAPRAQKQIKKLDPSVLPHVLECLELLEKNQHPIGVEKLNQDPNFWRIKAGNSHRVVYTILSESRTIIVALVSPRREVYREVANLNHGKIIQLTLPESQPRLAQGTRH